MQTDGMQVWVCGEVAQAVGSLGIRVSHSGVVGLGREVLGRERAARECRGEGEWRRGFRRAFARSASREAWAARRPCLLSLAFDVVFVDTALALGRIGAISSLRGPGPEAVTCGRRPAAVVPGPPGMVYQDCCHEYVACVHTQIWFEYDS